MRASSESNEVIHPRNDAMDVFFAWEKLASSTIWY